MFAGKSLAERARNLLLPVLCGLMLAGWALGQPAARAAESAEGACGTSRPNILLIMTDDQGWGDTSYNGHPVLKTPDAAV